VTFSSSSQRCVPIALALFVGDAQRAEREIPIPVTDLSDMLRILLNFLRARPVQIAFDDLK
jgi:hypothetical protein